MLISIFILLKALIKTFGGEVLFVSDCSHVYETAFEGKARQIPGALAAISYLGALRW